jgi:5-enolpyruvylshikimate-3-phosphate synthase
MTTFMTGDASLRRRPMGRAADPLRQMGARIVAREGGRMPLAVIGAENPLPIEYAGPVPSAQVKSAVLLAGLNAPGETIVVETAPTRDHTERMLRHFGAEIAVADGEAGRRITLKGRPELAGADLVVPGDPSSAAFPVVAALLRRWRSRGDWGRVPGVPDEPDSCARLERSHGSVVLSHDTPDRTIVQSDGPMRSIAEVPCRFDYSVAGPGSSSTGVRSPARSASS